MNCRMPVGNSTARLTSNHRSASFATCDTGCCRNPSPNKRKSTTSTAPPIRAKPARWRLAIRGKNHGELRIMVSGAEYCSHLKKSNTYIGGVLLTTHEQIDNRGSRLPVAIEPIHLIRDHAAQRDQDDPQHQCHAARYFRAARRRTQIPHGDAAIHTVVKQPDIQTG